MLGILRTNFFFDVVTVQHRLHRYFQEVKNARNSLAMRKTYAHLRREIDKNGIPQCYNHA